MADDTGQISPCRTAQTDFSIPNTGFFGYPAEDARCGSRVGFSPRGNACCPTNWKTFRRTPTKTSLLAQIKAVKAGQVDLQAIYLHLR